ERRSFHFLQGERPSQAPHYLSLQRPGAPAPWPAGEDWTFSLGRLEECISRPAEWKQQHDFPLDVDQVVVTGSPEWERVVVDHPEHLLAALILTSAEDGSDRLLGFAIRQEGWSLQAEAPVFILGRSWQGTL